MIARLAFAAIAAAAFAVPAAAQGNNDGPTVVRDNDRVIVMTDRHRVSGNEGQLPEGRRFRVYGGNGEEMGDCGADRHVVDRSSPDGHERTKVIICGHTELSAEERSARLEHVLERIQHMDGLSDASKDRVTAALRGAIEELRNTH